MDYTISKDNILTTVKDITSRVAAQAYAENSQSLYDGILITSGDAPQLDRFLEEGINAIITRAADICTRSTTQNPFVDKLVFDVPDITTGAAAIAPSLLNSYLAYFTSAKWFAARYASAFVEYDKRATSSLEEAIKQLRKRQIISRRF